MTNALLHDQLEKEVYQQTHNTVLFPGDVDRLSIALRKMIGEHHSAACMARLQKDERLAKIHEGEFEEYCALFERLLGKSPVARSKT